MVSAEREPISESEGRASGHVGEAPSWSFKIFLCIHEAGKFAFLGSLRKLHICAVHIK